MFGHTIQYGSAEEILHQTRLRLSHDGTLRFPLAQAWRFSGGALLTRTNDVYTLGSITIVNLDRHIYYSPSFCESKRVKLQNCTSLENRRLHGFIYVDLRWSDNGNSDGSKRYISY